jgi:hypothetical protein
MAPSAWLVTKVAEYGITLSDFARDEAEEVVILSRKVRGNDETAAIRKLVDYQDTPETVRYREAVRALNAFLSAADITFLDDGEEPCADPIERAMKRYFVIREGQEVRFDQGGRLFGGFWQTLRSERRKHIRFSGKPVAVLDYSSMFTRLAYAEIGAQPPEGDLYAIPGLEGYRSGVKTAMNCFLFDAGRRRKWPSDMGVGVGDDHDASTNPEGEVASFKGRLPHGWTVVRTRTAILKVHPALADAWDRQLGFRLMFLESQILLAVLEDLTRTSGTPEA